MQWKDRKRMLPGMLLLLVVVSLPSAGLAFGGSEDGRRPPEPPPEAYAACENKAAGDEVTLKGPHGHAMKGVCREQGDRLVAVPTERPSGPPGGQR